VFLLNNDAVFLQEVLKTSVEYAEIYNVEDVVLKYKTTLIDTAGVYT